eukprot:7200827-Lingulodinium_polyedra.AAC.1
MAAGTCQRLRHAGGVNHVPHARHALATPAAHEANARPIRPHRTAAESSSARRTAPPRSLG